MTALNLVPDGHFKRMPITESGQQETFAVKKEPPVIDDSPILHSIMRLLWKLELARHFGLTLWRNNDMAFLCNH